MIHQSQPEKFYDIFRPKMILHKVNRCESARAVSGRRCPQSGVGVYFLASRQDVFAKTTVTRKRKVEKSFQMCKVNLLSMGYKRAVTKIRVVWQNNGFSGKKRRFLAPKKSSLLGSIHDLSTTVKSCANQKVSFFQII